MNAILHGAWIAEPQDRADELFFVWAERAARAPRTRGQGSRVRRHPYAATTIEIADLLASYVPEVDWRAAERLTRVVLLPSTESAPRVPQWLLDEPPEEDGDLSLVPWRVRGSGCRCWICSMCRGATSVSTIGRARTTGTDIRFWGQAAKFALGSCPTALFAGVAASNGTIRRGYRFQ